MKPYSSFIRILSTLILFFCMVTLIHAQFNPIRPDSKDRVYEVLLIGNTGASGIEKLTPTLQLLRYELEDAGNNSAVVFLGDLLQCCGMPEVGEKGRDSAEQQLLTLIETVRDFPGKIIFIPGNNDWGQDKNNGWEAVVRMEKFIEAELDRGNVFIPDDGFPGPKHVKLTDDIRLIALNTEWLLTKNNKPTGDAGRYNVTEDDEFYVELGDLIMQHSTQDLIIVGHHPLYSNGRYAGYRHPYSQLFPLTEIWEPAYLPIPILGSMAITIDKNIGDEQYFLDKKNSWMRKNIDKIISDHEDFVYVSAHEYSLQLFKSELTNKMQKYLISGSAAKTEYVAQGYKRSETRTEFVSDEKGFSSLHYYKDGSVWIEFMKVNKDGTGSMIHESILREPNVFDSTPTIITDNKNYPDYSDSTIIVAPEPDYKAGWLQEFLVGSNHRDVWTTPIEVPYFDISKEHSGLTPVKKGGGQQTTSIRLKDANKKQYALRSVNKDGKRFLPEEVRETFVSSLSQDFLSYSHPLGAYIVPSLADAVGVYHTNPKLVYVPNDPRLGEYQQLIGNMLMLYEERPNKDMSDEAWFGNSKNVIGAPEVYRNVTNDNDNRVDAKFMARCRLFDMWMSDWDRHEDQWRWASFKSSRGKGKTYRPIPRDRDQAFNRLNFFLHPLIKPFIKFQDFQESYGSIKGLTTNGRQQDHRFLSELSKADWLTISDSMKFSLTDEIITSAFQKWPEPVFALNGNEMIEIGKVRRDKLPEVAEEFYDLHARSVDVIGSNKHERFEVERMEDDKTQVRVFKTSKEGIKKEMFYSRIMDGDETDEICLYGLGGNDNFIIKGDESSSIDIYAVGGTGDDTFIDSSNSETNFYDSKKHKIIGSNKTDVTISDDPRDNDYPGGFEYPQTYPLALAWYNSNDGLVLLGGVLWNTHSFRKNPYASQHTLSASFATTTSALNFHYTGSYRQMFGYYWHLGLNIDFRNNNNFRNFYGLGNETEPVDDVDSVRVFLGEINFDIPFKYESEAGWKFDAVPKIFMVNVRDDQHKLSYLEQSGLSDFTLEPQYYLGGKLFFDFTYQDDRDNPRHGYNWLTAFDGNVGLYNAPDNYLTIESELSHYFSLWTRRQYTFAVRVGGGHNFGDFPFYASNALGGTTNLRGYRSTRFSGRSSLYLNTELRLNVIKIGGDVLPGMLGLLGFFDVGRVWTDDEISKRWHNGYGFDVWYDIVGEIVVRFSVGFSNEDTTYLFGSGFFF